MNDKSRWDWFHIGPRGYIQDLHRVVIRVNVEIIFIKRWPHELIDVESRMQLIISISIARYLSLRSVKLISGTYLLNHLFQPRTSLFQRLDIPFWRSPLFRSLDISTFVSPLLTIRAFSIGFRVHRSFTSYLFPPAYITCSLLVSLPPTTSG